MGVKLGPKLELSFWSIGYIVLAVGLLIFNISWISSSIGGVLLGRKERAVFDSDVRENTKDYLDSIEALLKDSGLEPKKKEILTARAARLCYNLKITEQARKHYEQAATSSNPDVAARAEVSMIAIDFDQAPTDSNKPEMKTAAIEAALKRLDALAVKYPLSTDVKAAQGALYMNYFTGGESAAWVVKSRELLKQVKAPGASPGNIESRRNILMLDLAVHNFDETVTADDEKMLFNLRAEAKKIAPYVSDVKKTPQVLFLETYNAAVKDNAVGPPLLGQIATLAGVQGEEYANLVNTVVGGVVPTLTTPKARENMKIMVNSFKNAQRFAPKLELNYANAAAINIRYAAVQDQLLEEALNRLKSQGDALPIPFGTSDKVYPEVTSALGEEERCLNEAAGFLKAGLDEPGIDNAVKRTWARNLVDIHLWRAALSSTANRSTHLNAALLAVVAWHDLDPKNTEMMLTTAKIYELLGKNAERNKALEEAIAAGAKVTASQGPESNEFRAVTVYPGNPLQFGTTDFQVRGQPVLVGCTFLVQGYTEKVDSNTVKLNFNGQAVPVTCLSGIAYALVKPDKMTSQNTFELKMALSPQLSKSSTASFRFKAK